MTKSALCIVNNQTSALKIVASLRSAALRESEISVLFPDTSGLPDTGQVASTVAPEAGTPGIPPDGTASRAAGLLPGSEPVAIPGVGPFIAAGPLLAALQDAAARDASSVVGALTGMGVPEFEAQRYEEKLRDGNYLICAHCSDGEEVERARTIFEKARAEDIGTSDEAAVLA